MRVFKLKFRSALHVDSKGSGNPEVSDEFIRSDTLSAALALSWAALYPKEADDRFFHDPPYRVSSAFPYIGDILLFPMPVWRIWKEIDPKQRKEAKEIRWLSQELFEDVLAGKPLDFGSDRIRKLNNGIAVSKAELERNPAVERIQAWMKTERQRVSVDRLGIPKDGGLYFFALQFFAPESGLYFLAKTDEAPLERFRAALAFLGDTGIGADRSSGLGHFEIVSETELKLRKTEKTSGVVTLSLFNPDEADNIENLLQTTAYGLIIRSGWISQSTIGRPPIRVFSEGSYFSAKPKGRVVETLPDRIRDHHKLGLSHSACRDFRAVFLPCAAPPYLKEVAQ
ncbi:type III-A CRISPR-associated RAMP protein Csm4 [Desulfatirhabdium butyrativorans]|uniref:type III-A CRISPR-associated RAMP protein Csm4 n=1 Tax=Desulfatirhabdium butyrativorans TaxID=340467 RepID=UPI0003FA999B|nr:type III-A CRISPR-associated RAMP protein Csm4 [Desulfatirhabdium butyrativorans]